MFSIMPLIYIPQNSRSVGVSFFFFFFQKYGRREAAEMAQRGI